MFTYMYIQITYIYMYLWIYTGGVVKMSHFFTNRLKIIPKRQPFSQLPQFSGITIPSLSAWQVLKYAKNVLSHLPSNFAGKQKHRFFGGMLILLLKSMGLLEHGPGKGFSRSGDDPQVFLTQGKSESLGFLR